MQAILTKFIGPTDTKGARVKATFAESRKSKTIHWDYELDNKQNHEAVVMKLTGDPKGAWIAGGTKDGYAWVRK